MMAQETAGHQGAFDAGDSIFHHILDSQTLELPFVGEIHLPTLHLGPYDLPITRHAVMMWVACAIILLVLWLATRRRTLVPRGIHNVMEAIVMFVRDELARKNIGHHGDRFVPYLLTTFVFILTSNLLGLIPYMATPTGNIGVTAGLAGMAFLMIQFAGMREHGVAGHFRNLVPHGLPAWLLPIMIPVEILGMFTKPFALFINGIEILVAFLQAYIFTMLTSLFIGMSVHPQH